MRPFNTFLRGFLGLLDAKTGGVSPQYFEDAMRATIDAYPFIFAQRREVFLQTTAAVGGIGFIGGVSLQVPDSEIWIADSVSVLATTTLAAGETLLLVPCLQQQIPAGTNRQRLLANAIGVTPWGVGTQAEAQSHAPSIALPGDRFGVKVLARGVYAGTVEILLSFVRIPI